MVVNDKTVIAWADPKTTNKDVEEVRFEIIWNRIFNFWNVYMPEMVMVESAIGGATTQHVTQRLNAVVCWELYKHEIAFAMMAPNSLKKNAVGNGRASKDEMLEAARVWWPECPHHDCADAYWLAREAAKVRVENGV